jgi:hypothetical protein
MMMIMVEGESENEPKYMIITLPHRIGRYDTEKVARANGGRLLIVKEFIGVLKDPIQYAKMKNDWYWTADTGLDFLGYLKIDYKDGTLEKVSENEYSKLPIMQRAYSSGGNGPVAIAVGYGGDIKYNGICFYVDAQESEKPDSKVGAIRVVLKKR